jgi:hypothetical protein
MTTPEPIDRPASRSGPHNRQMRQPSQAVGKKFFGAA